MSSIVTTHPTLLLVIIFLTSALLGLRLGIAVGLPSPGWRRAALTSAVLLLLSAVAIMAVHQPHAGLLSQEDVLCFVLVLLTMFCSGAAGTGYIRRRDRQ